MKSFFVAIILVLITLGGVFGYSYYYKDITLKSLENRKPFATVEVKKSVPVFSKPVVLDVVPAIPYAQQENLVTPQIEEKAIKESPVDVLIENEIKDLPLPIVDPMKGQSIEVSEPIIPAVVNEAIVDVQKPEVVKEIIPFEKKKKIAIIVTDISDKNIDSAIKLLELNKDIGLAFIYDSYTAMKKAKNAGFNNLVVNVVMQPFNSSLRLPDNTIKVDNLPLENKMIIDDIMSNSYMPIAIMNEMGSKVTSNKDTKALNLVMQEVKARNLGFVDSKTNFHSVADIVAAEHEVPYVANYKFIDRLLRSDKEIEDALNTLKIKAEKDGNVLAIGYYSPKFIRVLNSWIENLDEKYAVVPVANLLK